MMRAYFIIHISHLAITVLSHIHLFSKLITLMKNDSWKNDLSRERLLSLFFFLILRQTERLCIV